MRFACDEEATTVTAVRTLTRAQQQPGRGEGRESAARAGRRRAAPLGSYLDAGGRRREVVVRPACEGSRLVLDRDALTGADTRLVAHLAADEPAGNAQLMCCLYLACAPAAPNPCRRLRAEDERRAPFTEERDGDRCELGADELTDGDGLRYTLVPLRGAMRIPELRWCRRAAGGLLGGHTPRRPTSDLVEIVSLREVVASFESYEPACSLTRAALRRHAGTAVSSTVLRLELERVLGSPIVLNRRLREVVLAAVEREALSMSEIAMRCGRVKRDRNGNESGETSWLARRLGLLAEGGQRRPTPWIHSDVLALIARRGLGIAPREVEL